MKTKLTTLLLTALIVSLASGCRAIRGRRGGVPEQPTMVIEIPTSARAVQATKSVAVAAPATQPAEPPTEPAAETAPERSLSVSSADIEAILEDAATTTILFEDSTAGDELTTADPGG